MESLLKALKALLPILAPLGEQGIEQLWETVIDPYINGMSDSADMKDFLKCVSPGMKAFAVIELKKLV